MRFRLGAPNPLARLTTKVHPNRKTWYTIFRQFLRILQFKQTPLFECLRLIHKYALSLLFHLKIKVCLPKNWITLQLLNVLCIGQIEASTCPPGQTPGIWHLCRPGEEGIWLSESSRGWGIWSPCFRGGEFELHPRFHVKSLAWRAIMGDAVLEDFRGKDCAFVANWLWGKGLNKLGYEYMNV